MTFNFNLNPYKKASGKQSVRLRILTSNKDIAYINTSVSILSNQWDEKKQLVKRHPLEEQLNASLTELVTEAKKLHYKNKSVSAKRLVQIYKSGNSSTSFIKFFETITEAKRLNGKTRTANTCDRYISKLKKFSSEIYFSDLSVSWAKDYELFMLKRGNKRNTIASNFKVIKSVLNKAVSQGLIENNPLRSFKIETENVDKEFLTIEEIGLIQNHPIEPRFKGMIKARDMFLFSFYAAGMRFTDLCKLKWDNIKGSELVYTMNKSKNRAGSKRYLDISHCLHILEPYKGLDEVFVFPTLYGMNDATQTEIEHRIFISNNNTNRSLKILGKHCGIKKPLNMHLSKHSFSNHLVRNNVGIHMISNLLGHTKLNTTQAYLKDFYGEEANDVLRGVFGK